MTSGVRTSDPVESGRPGAASPEATAPREESSGSPRDVELSPKERAQWMLHQLVPGRGVCNLSAAVEVDRPLRWWPLQEALNHLVRRHPALRIAVRSDASALRKRFLPEDQEVPLTVETATEDTLGTSLVELASGPFDLDGGILVRAHLITVADTGGCVVSLVLHHLVGDLVTLIVLTRELSRLYDSFAETGQPTPDLSGPVPARLEPPPDPGALEYWTRHLDGVDSTAMAMAGARPVEGRPTFSGGRVERDLPAAAVAAVARIRERTRMTQNVVLMTAFYLTLARHGAGPDLVIGVPVSGRTEDRGEAVGFHNVTLPVRVSVDDQMTVDALLRRVAVAFLEGVGHRSVSFEAVRDRLPGRSGDWRVPLFRHMFNYRSDPSGHQGSTDGAPLEMAGRPARRILVSNAFSRLDLELCVYPSESKISVEVVYSDEIHDAAFVRRWMDRYEAIVREMADRLDEPVGAVSGWSPAERAEQGGASAGAMTPPDRHLLTVIRERAEALPLAPALRCSGRTVSYRELVATADLVRRRLMDLGVGRGDIVALHATRGPSLAAATLGVWAAGAAYLPLDPAHPATRLADQIADAGAAAVIADAAPDPACLVGRPWLPLPDVVRTAAAVQAPTGSGLGEWPSPELDSPAYVIYTSGSTGKPKGVVVSHANLANVVFDFVDRLRFGPEDRMLWLTTMSFDIAGLELFLPLAAGGTVVVGSDVDRMDPDRLLDLIVDQDVTVAQATPTTWRHVGGRLRGQLDGRRVLCGGEPLSPALAELLLSDGCRLFNVYGPTETTIWSTAVELTSPVPNPVPIGSPIANTTVRLLTPEGRPVLPGVPGEVCIGGAGVARGYHGLPELTAQRFCVAPGFGRYYRTGDLARLTGSGLVFLGRLDRQVKVRGHRVEPVEVEAVLEEHPAVRTAAVITEPDSAGHLRLVAAIVAEPAVEVQSGELLRDHVADRLPAGAVPGRYVFLPELPLTGNGKVDHRELAARLGRLSGSVELPADPRLRSLVRLWREALGDDRLGADADFFLNGGHSLLAVNLAAQISALFGVRIEFDTIFDTPSPERLLPRLRTEGETR
ncbi:non-ribosomal peptide synthetase [Plantactinospora sp. WMMB782]|uniref:non-ribosomal peptide synthetase n=1 Tax=Plantactinospora sp. WMMB782 TaxID=3404121 RepID=UPI003B94BDF5